jgi:acetyltransferase-like isoleucine patch superfamily enzyme
MSGAFVHATAHVEDGATLGPGTRIWHQAQVRPGARLGAGCIVGKGAFIDLDVEVGDHCKIQNYACVYHGTRLGNGVFVGPHVVFTNDRFPRAINPDGSLKTDDDWEVGETTVGDGASIGARSVILPGLHIGAWALIGAGSVVTRDVPAHAIVAGVPARRVGWACTCGRQLDDRLHCATCARGYREAGDGGLEPSDSSTAVEAQA